MTLSAVIRKQVRERAQFLCEFCHSSEETSAAQFEIDHILPRSLGGLDELENLALACQRCDRSSRSIVLWCLGIGLKLFEEQAISFECGRFVSQVIHF